MIRIAQVTDDRALRTLAGRPVPGAVSLAFTADPSYFDAVRVHGRDARILVAERGGQVVAMGVVARRRVFVNGTPQEVGYLGGLRVDPVAQHGSILGRGYASFGHLHREALRLPFYLTTIMEDNTVARKLLTSGRAGLPEYREVGRYRTEIVSATPTRPAPATHETKLVDGVEAGWESVLRCLREKGSQKQFFPVLDADDFEPGAGSMHGLGLESFVVAQRKGETLGTLALWDQRPFRQVRVMRYSLSMTLLRAVSRLLAPLSLLPALPPPRAPLRLLHTACVAVRGNDPELLAPLFAQARRRAHALGANLLATGFFADDPLVAVPGAFPHVTLHSRVYCVTWGDGAEPATALDGRLKYLELGSL